MNAYIHGGDLENAEKVFNIKARDFLDFSSNINAVGYPDELEEIIINSIKSLGQYPDNKCQELRNAMSQYLEVDKSEIIPGNGAMEIIEMAIKIPIIKNILIIAPTFVEYEKLSIINNKNVKYYCLKENEDFQFTPDDILTQIDESIDAIIVCNPNNPTSKLYEKDKMVYFVEQCFLKNIVIILDETFIELTIDGNTNSLCDKIKQYSNLIIIRAATKYFGIPGIRLGYAVTSNKYGDYFWNNKPSWSVNTFATSLNKIFLNEKNYRKKTLEWMTTEINFLYNQLKEIAKFQVYKPDTIFILLKIIDLEFSSSDLYKLLGEKGILIREAQNFKFLNDRFIRIAVKNRQSNVELIENIKKVFNVG